MANKAKARTIVENKWERKKYLQESDSGTIKDVIKIRLHMWQVNCNYKRDKTDTKCPRCKKSENTTEHVLECENAKKFTFSKEHSKGEWEEITEIYRKNKKNRELAEIKVQDQYKIIKENRKKNKIRKIKEKEKSREIERHRSRKKNQMIKKESQRRKIEGSKKESRREAKKETVAERESRGYAKKDPGERQKVEDRETRTQEKKD